VDETLLAGLRWRAVGPAVFGGRVSDVAGVAGNPNILYVAFASAGLFKSRDGGISFESVFDSGNTLSIGAIAVAPDNPEAISRRHRRRQAAEQHVVRRRNLPLARWREELDPPWLSCSERFSRWRSTPRFEHGVCRRDGP
jgi:hypothetical protein